MEWLYVMVAIGIAFILEKLLPLSGWMKLLFLGGYGLLAIYIYFKSKKTIQLLIGSAAYLILSSMLAQSYLISMHQGTVMTMDWWEALNWIRNNTENCSVIATYWDPGHFITSVAKRQVVFDGASQNSLLIIEKDGKKTVRSRIKDIATVLFTDNETLAVDILRNYRNDSCPMYFIASRDLIFKSQWWTYFATWNPIEKGKKHVYYVGRLVDRRPLLDGSGMEYLYSVGGIPLRVIFRNGTIQSFIGSQPIGKIYYFTDEGIYLIGNSSDLSLFLFGQGGDVVVVPKELENSLFTRMFFFNGYGLEKFEFIRSWGSEVKLFKVKFE